MFILNASPPNFINDEGSVSVPLDIFSKNALNTIDLIVFGIIIYPLNELFSNAESDISIMFFDKFNDEDQILKDPRKTFLPIVITASGITIFLTKELTRCSKHC